MTQTENKSKPKVLYVDDEKNNLMSFKAAFRMDFEIFLANSPDEALELLTKEEVHIIISDYRMPLMTGVELFEKIRFAFPRPFRVLLTAYGDVQSLTDAINKGNVFRYIKKPWVDEDIKSAVKEAHDFYVIKNSLEQKNNELVEAYRDLDRFVYSVSHDLRSPLMGILAVSNLINRDTGGEEVEGYIDLIKRNITKLDYFVISLLEYYRVKRGQLTIVDIDFQNIFDDIQDIYKAELMAQNIKFIMEVDQLETFRSDKLVITIAIQNFMSNSIKYQKQDNQEKFIKLKATVDNGEAVIVIEDNGIGIEGEYIPKIFDMFFRASSQASGSGIGLYNAKHALDKLGAVVRINSTIHVGTLFEVTIPSK